MYVMQQYDGWGPPEAEAGTAAESFPEVTLKHLRRRRSCFAGKIIDRRPMNKNQPDANTGKHGGSGGPECLRWPGWEFSRLPEAILVFLSLCFFLWVLKDGSQSVFPLGKRLDCGAEQRSFFYPFFCLGSFFFETPTREPNVNTENCSFPRGNQPL